MPPFYTYISAGSTALQDFTMTYTIPSADPTLTLPTTINTGQSIDVDWGDGTVNSWGGLTTPTHTYSGLLSDTDFQVKIIGAFLNFGFNNSGDRLKLKSIDNWGIYSYDLANGFYGCSNLSGYNATDYPIGITSLLNTFNGCVLFNGNISNWVTDNVTIMSNTFREASSFNQPIGSWNTLNVSNTTDMFRQATSFNQPIGSWDTSSVISMVRMFYLATSFDQNIGSWNVSNVSFFSNFMLAKTPSTFSAANLDAIYNGWSALPSVQSSVNITFGTAQYTSAAAAGRAILTSAPNNWTITDGGLV